MAGSVFREYEPRGNRFENIFDTSGRITDIKDEEEGQRTFSREAFADGDICYEKVSAENIRTSYPDHTDSAGYTSVITNSAGRETHFSESADGLTVNKSLPCGTDPEFSYGTDLKYKTRYVRKMTETTPAGLERVTEMKRVCTYTDSDNDPDVITEIITLNRQVLCMMSHRPSPHRNPDN